ncbi:glucuronyl hydrolase [Paenibacillus sp. MY03]|uniref:glycoside hydrolase family 88 protein n=1 Tax=Paenibacillus sp. MY03 TaxID=302980 RepID=UPI000B3CAAD5|nr:glycoside hydrolase family 88 protein [Paenibacillus sp. MY03]OUS70810.1 glucuronyl hydrolase [Paenibacillus sp. MY03]
MAVNPTACEAVRATHRFNHGLSKDTFRAALDFVMNRIDHHLEAFTDRFPSAHSVDQVYQPVDNASLDYYSDWTSSFWTGMVWLAYELTEEPKYRDVAERHVASFKTRLEKRDILNHHDIGFLYSLSCVAGYRLTGSEEAKRIALDAAKLLSMRFQEKSGIIQVRGYLEDRGHKERGVFIIDCSMNVPLLYWASTMTGDRTYYDKAYRHMSQVMEHMVRDDGSSYQVYHIDADTGEPTRGWTSQGHADEDCWSRGQAWVMYGLPLSYRYTGDKKFIDAAKHTCNYFLNHLPEDLVCNWDLVFTDQDGQRDTSAAAIAACGLLELARHLPVLDEDRTLYENAALAILGSLAANYTTADDPGSNGVLGHGVYSLPKNLGVDECNIWGDYFYMEALVRVLRDWKPYW